MENEEKKKGEIAIRILRELFDKGCLDHMGHDPLTGGEYHPAVLEFLAPGNNSTVTALDVIGEFLRKA